MSASDVRFSRKTAADISARYANTSREKSYAQSFWRDIFTELCRIDTFALVEFEHAVISRPGEGTKSIDALWPGVVLIEHKSRGKSLDEAEVQARQYLTLLPNADRPPYVIVSDFAVIRIINILTNDLFEFPLADLPDEAHRFGAIIDGHHSDATLVEESADRQAAELMGSLYTAFETAGQSGHDTSIFLMRLLFLLFAEDTGLLRAGAFGELVESSQDDGTGLGAALAELFDVLNTPLKNRLGTLSARLATFPYVNGKLFAESLRTFVFNREMRNALLAASRYDWSGISPAVFGSLFQAVRDAETRRAMGEHYTSVVNIKRVISNLFLNDFREKFLALIDNPVGLRQFREELSTYRWLDPAGGSGNFLIVAYREMRSLEHDIIRRLQELDGGRTQLLTDGTAELRVELTQFHGIEIDEWSSAIARVGMFLADHQANLELELLTGTAPNLLPLNEAANIVTADALEIPWDSVCELDDRTFIMGNPPFLGARRQSPEQKQQTERIWSDTRGSGSLDYVTNWLRIAADFAVNRGSKVAFVASKSISQGEQPAILWGYLTGIGISIAFAHQSFEWRNGSKQEATVHVVILGLSPVSREAVVLWRRKRGTNDFVSTVVENINAYLLAAPNILISRRSKPLAAHVPEMRYGSQPNDGGHISNITSDEAERIRESDAVAASYLRRIIGAREVLHNEERWCLWLVDATPAEIRQSPELRRRLQAVREQRLASRRAATQELADTPGLFGFIAQPESDYIAIPRHSSSEREYIPFAYFPPSVVTTDALSLIPDAPKWLFGAISSRPFVVWSHAVSGRLGEGIRISGGITYNNFPFPEFSGDVEEELAAGAQAVLDARTNHSDASLADLYENLAMPVGLRRAHQILDSVMMEALGVDSRASDEDLLEAMFDRYRSLTEPVRS